MRARLASTVKDRAGNAIQNARVFVRERATTDAVTDLFATESGGVAIADGSLVTNNQGEIEGYLDAARYVDLFVTDNSDAAYYPATPSRLLDFASFTELGVPAIDPEDIETEAGAQAKVDAEAAARTADVDIEEAARMAADDAHEANTINVHGIADTTALITQAAADTRYVNETDHTKAAHDALALSHDSLSDVSADDHHAKSHVHDGADGSGSVAHASLTGIGENDHHNKVHGSDEHTDVVRSLWLGSKSLELDGATAGTRGSAPDSIATLNMTNGATQGVFQLVQLPDRAKPNSPVSIVIHWETSVPENGTQVVWSVDAKKATPNSADGLTAAGTTTQFTGTNADKGADKPIAEAATQIVASASPRDLIRVNVRRLGADAADTYTNIVRLIGLELQYTAVE